MRRFVEGIDRGQATLFPECLAGDGSGWVCEATRNGRGKASMHVAAVRPECPAQFAIQAMG